MSDVSDQTIEPTPVVPEPSKDSVSYESYSKVLNQRKSDQLKLKDLTEAHNALLAENKSAADAADIEQGKFQELFEAEQLKAKGLQESIDLNTQQHQHRLREEALRKEIGPLRKPEYLKFADVTSIVMDDGGSIDLESVKQVALQFKDSYSDLIQPAEGTLPNAAPKDGAKGLTMVEWGKLSAVEQRARQNDVID